MQWLGPDLSGYADRVAGRRTAGHPYMPAVRLLCRSGRGSAAGAGHGTWLVPPLCDLWLRGRVARPPSPATRCSIGS